MAGGDDASARIANTARADIVARLLLFIAIVALLGALNALRDPGTDRSPRRRPPWLLVMLTVELIPTRVIVWAALLGAGAAAGAFDQRAGRLALWLTVATWTIYVVLTVRATRARGAVHAALDAAGVNGSPDGRIDVVALLTSNPYLTPRTVARIEDVEFAPGLHLDLYVPRGHDGSPSPSLVQIHGGGWRGGSRRQQGRPLVHHMAERGWVAAAVSYPLVPAATFPDQLIAIKQALRWLRTRGTDHGIDPDRIFVTGGSAGAHLAALTALTANDPRYQPGFETVDTSVQGAVTLYGIYDFLNRNATRDPWPVIPRGVMKSDPDEDVDRYRAASPLDQVRRDAPPFFVLHGSRDSLVGTAESRQFARALRDASERIVVYAEIPAATHAFDVIPSLRTQLTVGGIARFLESVAADGGPRR